MSEVALAQTDPLRTAIEFLRRAPAAAAQCNVGQEAERIVRVKHFLRDHWAGQNRKVRYRYGLVMKGRRHGIDESIMRILESQIAHLELIV